MTGADTRWTDSDRVPVGARHPHAYLIWAWPCVLRRAVRSWQAARPVPTRNQHRCLPTRPARCQQPRSSTGSRRFQRIAARFPRLPLGVQPFPGMREGVDSPQRSQNEEAAPQGHCAPLINRERHADQDGEQSHKTECHRIEHGRNGGKICSARLLYLPRRECPR